MHEYRPRPVWTRPATWAALALAAVVALVLVRCNRAQHADAVVNGAPTDMPAATAPPAAVATTGSLPPADAAALARRNQAVADAIDAVHDYLQAVGAHDFERADALWQPNRSPTPHDEAGLRELGPLRALRIQNRAPVLPPGMGTPDALEVPVQLVAHVEGGKPVRLHGHYRVRRDAVRARWEIAGAALRPVID